MLGGIKLFPIEYPTCDKKASIGEKVCYTVGPTFINVSMGTLELFTISSSNLGESIKKANGEEE